MASRRKARETLLKLLYTAESRSITIDQAFREMSLIDREIELAPESEESEELLPLSGRLDLNQQEYVLSLGRKIEQNREQLDSIIDSHLKNWEPSRVARIDRIILRIALAEMQYRPDIPHAVSINEAIELAKRFSSGKSTGFINGILDAAVKIM